MDNFVVSARKYRPSTFSTVVGQEHITNTLKNAIGQQQLAQAFLFCGPRGVGKTTCARILAKTINCLDKTEDHEPCNKCSSCESFNKNGSYNIIELDAASNNSVEDIRNLVDQVRYAPTAGQKKVYIIDEVHMLSNQAFNAFLKTLEEPPSYAIFILATTEKHKIIPTILSRCQIFDFNRIKVADIAKQLTHVAQSEAIEAEQDALHLIGEKADGGMRDALSMFDMITTFSADRKITYAQTIENLHILDYDYFFKTVDALYNEDMATTLNIFDDILRKGFDAQHFITGLTSHLRDLLVCKDPKTINLLEVSESVKTKFKDQAETVNKSFLLTGMSLCHKCDLEFKQSKNQRLHVELTLIKVANIKNAIRVAQDSVEKKKPNVTTTAPSVGQRAPQKNKESTGIKSSLKPTIQVSTSQDALQKKAQERRALQEKELREKEVGNKQENKRTQSTTQLNEGQLKEAWEQYTKIITQEDKPLQLNILKNNLFRVEGNKIIIGLNNAVQQSPFQKLKISLFNFLKESFGHDDFTIEHEVLINAPTDNQRPYTQQEKLNHILERHPYLKDFKQNLGLDLDS